MEKKHKLWSNGYDYSLTTKELKGFVKNESIIPHWLVGTLYKNLKKTKKFNKTNLKLMHDSYLWFKKEKKERLKKIIPFFHEFARAEKKFTEYSNEIHVIEYAALKKMNKKLGINEKLGIKYNHCPANLRAALKKINPQYKKMLEGCVEIYRKKKTLTKEAYKYKCILNAERGELNQWHSWDFKKTCYQYMFVKDKMVKKSIGPCDGSDVVDAITTLKTTLSYISFDEWASDLKSDGLRYVGQTGVFTNKKHITIGDYLRLPVSSIKKLIQ